MQNANSTAPFYRMQKRRENSNPVDTFVLVLLLCRDFYSTTSVSNGTATVLGQRVKSLNY